MTQYPTKHNPRSAATARRPAFGTMLLSWLIPGYGFMRNGLLARGIFFFVILEITFLLGTVLRGTVLVPEFNFRDPAFNLVNILTFLAQVFNGGLALISMLPEILGPGAAILPYQEDYVWADLGAFFLLVSGGMNYFVLVKTYDHFYAEPKQAQPVVENS